MKHKCVAFLCVIASFCSDASAYSPINRTKSILSKNHESNSFISVKGNAPILLAPNSISIDDYVPLTFPSHVQTKGDAIKIKKNSSEFIIKKGSYLVTFTGTFTSNSPDGFTREVAIQIGSGVLLPFADTNVFAADATGISSISQIVHVRETSKLSIVARSFDLISGTTTAFNRSLSIERLHD